MVASGPIAPFKFRPVRRGRRRHVSVPEHGESLPATTSRVILSTADIDRALTRIAHEILESNKGTDDLVILGIARRGYPLAQR